MRLAGYLAIVLCLSLVTPTLAQQPQPQPPPEQPGPEAPPVTSTSLRIEPGRGLAGIGVGSALHVTLTRFGRPSEIRETAIDTVYAFTRFGITVYARKDTVTAVSTSNSLLKISSRLGAGYRTEDVIALFGRGFRDGTVEGFPGMIYDNRGIAFGLDRQAVAFVLVFRPGGAAQVSGLLPGVATVQPPVAGFPFVAGLRPFSQETNYMSLPGYLRWLVYQTSGTWITYAEAKRIVEEQKRLSR